MRQAENAASLLLGLTNVNPEPFLSYLPAIVNYCVLFFPTSTRFGGRESETVESGKKIARRTRHEKDLPQLLYNTLLLLQPLMAAKVEGVPEDDASRVAYVSRINKVSCRAASCRHSIPIPKQPHPSLTPSLSLLLSCLRCCAAGST